MLGWGYRTMVAAVVALVTVAAPAAAAGVGPPVPPPAVPGPTPIGSLDARHPVLGFSGTIGLPTTAPVLGDPVPPVCTAGCREYTFSARTGSAFLVSVKDSKGSMEDGFDLYLYDPAGRLVGAANGVGANGQAVGVGTPTSGTYTAVVTFTYAASGAAGYKGEVRLMAGRSWQPSPPTCGVTVSGVGGCFTLPVLRPLPASDLHVSGLPPVASTPLGFPLPVNVPTGSSCYTDESLALANPSVAGVQHPVLRCLRFTSEVQNVGPGPLDVRLPWLQWSPGQAPSSGFLPGQCRADQAVTTTSGKTVTRPAGPCEFHLEHGHFHYRDLISYTLYALDPAGGIGHKVNASTKASFCLGDDNYFGFGTAGPNGPRNYVGQPGCNLPGQQPSVGGRGSVPVEEGVSPGWGDVYTWDTPEQFVDITNTPPGLYDLVEETNPSNRILVAGPAHVCSLTELRLTPTTVQTVSTKAAVACPGG